MEDFEKILTSEQAAELQQVHEKFNCEIIELGLYEKGTVKVVVRGLKEDIESLFGYLEKIIEK